MLITAHGWTYGQQKEKGNEIEKPEATKPETSELNPAAKHATSFAAGAKAPTFGQDPLLDKWQMLFDLARQQHLQKDYAEAARNFAAIIEGKTTDEMKGACLVELAVLAQEQNQLAKAQQILAQYLRAFPQDQGVPEVLLRQGLLYRQMGAPALALSKFYAVMTSALTLKRGSVDHYQRIVLRAQTEIAETYYWQGKYEEAGEFYNRLLKLESAELNKRQIQLKLLRCCAATSKYPEAIGKAQEFLARHPKAAEEPEVRFVLADSLKRLGKNREAQQQVLLLVQSQGSAPEGQQAGWIYWQQRAGNEIANQMYQEGDFVDALEIYSALAALDKALTWEIPVLYQIGLIYERLHQPEKASTTYTRILAREKELALDASLGLKTVVEMAKWRNNFLDWQAHTERPGQTNAQLKAEAPLSAAR